MAGATPSASPKLTAYADTKEPMRYSHWHDALDPDTCLSVDGDAPGRLHLSHWPGNRTPERFRHDLSTGMCLKLANAKDRDALLTGINLVTNNHWDTDGACSVFACLEPALALVHANHLLAAALAGDFSVFTTPEGVKLDLTLTALTRHADSPVASAKFSDDLERRQAQYEHALQLIPKLLANPDLHADWFAQEYWTIQQHLRMLREDEADIEMFDALDFAIVMCDQPLHPHAVNTAAACDRILTVLNAGNRRFSYELRLSTLSWFDLQSGRRPPRQDWAPLLERLNAEAGGEGIWVADSYTLPTPGLACMDGDEPALITARPELVRRIVAEFFAANPYLPAGV
jgi:hypothetical protein